LTAEQERALGQRIQLGKKAGQLIVDVSADMGMDLYEDMQLAIDDGRQANHEFVEAFLRLPVAIAKRYRDFADYGDLIQEGNIGLLEAVDKFDPEKGFRFSTFAAWRIKNKIFREMNRRNVTSGVSVDKTVRLRQIEKYEKHDDGKPRTNEELSDLLRLSIDEILELQFLRNAINRSISLDEPLTHDSDSTMGDVVIDTKSWVTFDEVELQFGEFVFSELFESLTDRMIQTLQLRYGLYGGSSYSSEEIAEMLGVSPRTIYSDLKEAKKIIKIMATEKHPGFKESFM